MLVYNILQEVKKVKQQKGNIMKKLKIKNEKELNEIKELAHDPLALIDSRKNYKNNDGSFTEEETVIFIYKDKNCKYTFKSNYLFDINNSKLLNPLEIGSEIVIF